VAQQGRGGAQTQSLQFFVDGGVLLDEQVLPGDVGFGLIVVVVADEVLDMVLGEELFELTVELCREGFVVGHDEGGFLHLLDDPGHGVGLTRSGDPHKGLIAVARLDGCGQCLDRLRLIPGRSVGRMDFEAAHFGAFCKVKSKK